MLGEQVGRLAEPVYRFVDRKLGARRSSSSSQTGEQADRQQDEDLQVYLAG